MADIVLSELMDMPDVLSEETTAEQLQEWIRYCMIQWVKEDTQDEELFFDFKVDFNNWEKATFTKAGGTIIKRLRAFLRGWGVWLHNGKDISDSLDELNKREEPAQWSEEEFKRQRNTKKLFSRDLKELEQSYFPLKSVPAQNTETPPAQPNQPVTGIQHGNSMMPTPGTNASTQNAAIPQMPMQPDPPLPTQSWPTQPSQPISPQNVPLPSTPAQNHQNPQNYYSPSQYATPGQPTYNGGNIWQGSKPPNPNPAVHFEQPQQAVLIHPLSGAMIKRYRPLEEVLNRPERAYSADSGTAILNFTRLYQHTAKFKGDKYQYMQIMLRMFFDNCDKASVGSLE